MAKKAKKRSDRDEPALSTLLRLPSGSVDWEQLDPRGTPGYPEDVKKSKRKEDAKQRRRALRPALSDLQERLYAAGRSDPETAPRILMLLQGMDTAGKGGVIRKAIGMVDPQGVQLTAFKQPTAEELEHDFLWRIRRALPDRGMIGIFDRSHYEDVLVARVEQLVPAETWQQRFDRINEFEAELTGQGIVLIKCFLHVSYEEQRGRLAERLERADKYWKYNPGDIDARLRWGDYQQAYADALERCNTDDAPWYVIPSDRKWYRNWAASTLLMEHLQRLGLGWPEADFDIDTEQRRLAET